MRNKNQLFSLKPLSNGLQNECFVEKNQNVRKLKQIFAILLQ